MAFRNSFNLFHDFMKCVVKLPVSFAIYRSLKPANIPNITASHLYLDVLDTQKKEAKEMSDNNP